MEDIRFIVIDTISEKLGLDVSRLNLKHDLQRDLGIDSLDIVELIQTLEKRFSIVIPDEIAEQLRTPELIVQHITEKI